MWTFTADKDFALGNSLFGAVKLTKITTDFDKYEFSGYVIGFDASASFSLTNGSEFGKNVIIFGAAMSSSLHIDNRRKDILVLGKGPAQGLGDTTFTAEAEYSINFSEQKKLFKFTL